MPVSTESRVSHQPREMSPLEITFETKGHFCPYEALRGDEIRAVKLENRVKIFDEDNPDLRFAKLCFGQKRKSDH